MELASEAAAALGVTVLKGRVLSADTFLADPERARLLRENLAGACVEMEGAATAQVCCSGVPFVVVRSISDRADGGAKPDFREFTALAAASRSRLLTGCSGAYDCLTQG